MFFFQFILWKPFSFKLYSTVASRSQQTGKKARQRRRSRLVKVPRHKRIHRKVVFLYLKVVSSLESKYQKHDILMLNLNKSKPNNVC